MNFQRSQAATALLILLTAACGGGGAAPITSPPVVQTMASLQVTPQSAAMQVGETYTVTARPVDQIGNVVVGAPAPGFASSDETVATVSPAGLVTAVAPGTATITATVQDGGVSVRGTCVLTVTAAVPGAGHRVETVGATFSPTTLTIGANDSVTWHFSGAVHNVTFSGAAPPQGNIGDQPPGATVTRVFPTPGTYAYECTRHSGMTGSVVVQGTAAPVFTSLSLTPATPAIQVAGSVQLAATPLDQYGSAMTGLPASSFASSAPAVASVSATGTVTGVGAGTAVITAALTAAGVTHSATATVSVSAPQSGNVSVSTPNQTFSPKTVTIPVGGIVTWQFSGGTHNVTFQGAAPAGGNIPDQPSGNAVSRTFAVVGTYDYECTRHGGMTGSVVVQGGGGGTGTYTSLAITPANPSVLVGSTVSLAATPLDENGVALLGLPAPTFISDNTVVATVDAAGVVRAVAAGAATITATLSAAGVTHTATTTVTVATTPPGPIVGTSGNTFTPEEVRIRPGGVVTWQFAATHNVTFTGPAPAGGDIPDTPAGQSVSRTFAAAGDYDYVCSIHKDMKGRVRVE